MAQKRLFTFPFTKFTKLSDGRLLVEGTATSEALDCQGDILDYEGSKKAFEKWTGNIRESHDPKKAVGKRLEVACDDVSKTITVKSFISAGAPNTQRLIEDGVLKAYSVGGDPKQAKLEKRDGKEVRRITEWDMVELSVVDVGANPDANDLVLCKADGATEALGEETPNLEGIGARLADSVVRLVNQGVEAAIAEPNRFAKALVDAVGTGAPVLAEETKSRFPAGATLARVFGKGGYLGSFDIATGIFKAQPKPKLAKNFEWGMPEDDLYCALDCLRSLRYLKTCEMAEGDAGEATFIQAAIDALCKFIAIEAGELVTDLAEPSVVTATVAASCLCCQGGACTGCATCTCGGVGNPCACCKAATCTGCATCMHGAMTGTMEMSRRPRGLSTLRLSRQIAALQKAITAIPAPAPAPVAPVEVLTPKDGDDIVATLGKHITAVSDTLVKAVGELKGATSVELKAIRDQVDVIAAQPMPGGPARRQPPAAMVQGATGRTSKVSSVLMGLAESLPDAGSRALMRSRAMAFEQSGD